MKHVLSFFAVAVFWVFFCPCKAAAEQCSRTRMRVCVSSFSVEQSSFAFKLSPVQPLSFYAGNLSFGGLWSVFSSAAPNALPPLKRLTGLREPLSVQFADRGLFPLHIAVDCTLPAVKTVLFIGIEKRHRKAFSGIAEYPVCTGAALSFPFTMRLPSKNHRQYIHCLWTIAWKRIFIRAKQADVWFTAEPFFAPFFANTFIQQLALQNRHSRLALRAGCSENPYGVPACFGQTDVSQNYGIFSHSAFAFFCTKNYLNQNGSFEKERIKVFYSPQLSFAFKDAVLHSLFAGISAGLWYEEKNTVRFSAGFWKSSVKTQIRLRFSQTELDFGAALSPLHFVQCTKQSVLAPECRFRFAGRKNGRTVFVLDAGIRGVFYPVRKNMLHAFKAGSGFTGNFELLKKIAGCASVDAVFSRTVAQRPVSENLSTTIKLRLLLRLPVGTGKARAALDARTEFLLKNTALQKIKGDIVFKLYL